MDEEIMQETATGIDANELQTRFSTLFVSKKQVPLSLSVSEEDQKKYSLPKTVDSVVETDVFTYYYGDFMHDGSEQHAIFEKMRRSDGNADLHLRITSPGGSVGEGVNLFNIARDKFKGRVTTYLDAEVASMGAIMFCAGDKRVAYEFSMFMVHNYSSLSHGKGDDILTSTKATDKYCDSFFRKLIVKTGFIDKSEYSRLRDGHDFYFDAEEMAIRGIATHVVVDGVELTAEQYVDYCSCDMDVEEFLEIHNELHAEPEEELTDDDIKALMDSLGFDIVFEDEDDEC